LLFLARFATNFRRSWYQWIQNCQAHHFLTGLQMNSHFLKKWEMNYERQKIDFVFWWLFKIVIWRPNRIPYPKSISSLGLCYTDTEIYERKVTPWPCNNFAGQCIYTYQPCG
jgi:hypothetical protein